MTRGVCRLFQNLGFGTLTEFKLSNGRRVDVMAVDRNGDFVIVESKVQSRTIVRTGNGTNTWYSANVSILPAGWFPVEIMPDDCGLIVADPYDAAVRRESTAKKLNANRKRRQLIRFALAASDRLRQMGEAAV